MSSDDHEARGQSPQLEAALKRVLEEIRGGVAHGHFEITVSGDTVKAGDRRVVVKAGRSFQFVIPLAEINR